MRRGRLAIGVAVVVIGAGAAVSAFTLVNRDGGVPAPLVVTVNAVGCRPTPTLASGTLVARGLVLTVAHALAGEDHVTVTTADGRVHTASVVAIDTINDGAVLDVPSLEVGQIAELGGESTGRGTLVTKDGPQPVEILRAVQIRTQDIYRDGEHVRSGYELQADVKPGDSGGAVLDGAGRLVGIAFAASRVDLNQAWATSISVLTPLVDSARAGAPAPTAACAR